MTKLEIMDAHLTRRRYPSLPTKLVVVTSGSICSGTVATATCTTILARMIPPCCLTKQLLGRFENLATHSKTREIYQIEWLYDIRALES